jgi:predicted hydrocarbon binding protein
MHGIVFAELQKFVGHTLGPQAWPELAADAGLGRPTFLATAAYPDDQLTALVMAAVRRTGIPAPQLLAQFGEFIVPDLVKVFGAFVKREWTALDLLEHTELVIHKAVRLQTQYADPPQLRITRVSPAQVRIEYSSPRRLCAVAKGIMRGVAKHYGETLAIDESTCMLTGAAACTLTATRR